MLTLTTSKEVLFIVLKVLERNKVIVEKGKIGFLEEGLLSCISRRSSEDMEMCHVASVYFFHFFVTHFYCSHNNDIEKDLKINPFSG